MNIRKITIGIFALALLFVVFLAAFFLSTSSSSSSSSSFTFGHVENLYFPRRRILVVMQFPPHQWSLAKENLLSWEKLFPCKQQDYSMVDLVFYVSNDDNGSLHDESLAFANQRTWRKCFSRVLFKNCQLTPQEDVYGVGTGNSYILVYLQWVIDLMYCTRSDHVLSNV